MLRIKDHIPGTNFRTLTHNEEVLLEWVEKKEIAEGEGVMFTNKALTLAAIIFVWGERPWMVKRRIEPFPPPDLNISIKSWSADVDFRLLAHRGVPSQWARKHRLKEGEGILVTNKEFSLAAVVFVWGGATWVLRSATHTEIEVRKVLLGMAVEALVGLEGRSVRKCYDLLGSYEAQAA